MRSKYWKRFSVIILLLAAFALALSGCSGSGSDGAAGAKGDQGDPGIQGIQGIQGADKTTGTVDAAQFTFDNLKNIALGGKIISASTAGDKPTVTFQVVNTATNEGIRGMRTFALHIAQLKPEANGSASYWLNYIADGLPLTAIPAASSAPVNTSADTVTSFNADGTVKGQGYSVVDNGDGTYVVTFGANIKANTKVPYDAALVHRVVVGVRSVAVPGVVGKTPGAYAGPVNPLTGAVFAQFTNTNGTNLVYDFTPSATGAGTMLVDSAGKQTFARDIVTIDACNQCHYKIQYGFPRGNNTSGHFGSRTDTRTCVMCHTPQLASGEGNFTSFIHKIHMGEELPKVETAVGLAVNEYKYPQDIRNCAWCHKGSIADSWKVKPTITVCGSCHNNVDFATGANHVGGKATSDALCAICHDAAGIALKHVSVLPPNPDSPEMGGTNTHSYAGYLPAAGVKIAEAAVITWDIKSVSVNATTKQPEMLFKFKKDGADVVFNTYAAGKELMDNFIGGPSIYFVWSVPQDGVTAPADYNASASTWLRNVWSGTATGTSAGTLAAPDASGYYKITLTGVTIPTTAKMLTGGVGYTYGASTPPLTQTNLSAYPYTLNTATGKYIGGLMTVVPNAWKVATGYTGRRLIVDNAKCNACHAALGAKPTFHAGNRNDAQTCTFCHTVNRTNSGWPVNINYDVHAIHGAALRTNKFSWEVSAGATYWGVGYPGLLKNCEMCHIAGMYDYTASASSSAVPNLLMTTAASGTMPATVNVITTGSEVVPGTYYSKFVTALAPYGVTFGYNAGTGITTPAADTTLVLSPISAACSGCHDSATARAHMQSNGGSVFDPRSTALASTEQCLICHGAANNAAFNETVPAIKTVHRWW